MENESRRADLNTNTLLIKFSEQVHTACCLRDTSYKWNTPTE